MSKATKDIATIYCRQCQKKRRPKFYYEATDKYLDTNGLMSVCSDCINDMYYSFYKSEHSLESAIYKICKIMNVAYSVVAIEATIGKISKMVNTKKRINVFGLYKASVSGIAMEEGEDRTFSELSRPIVNNGIDEILDQEDVEMLKELEEKWGGKKEYEDLIYLEKEFSGWKQTHKCDNKAEEFIFKELCYLQLDIKKAREEKKSTAPYLKTFQDLMKSGGITPAQSKASSDNKSVDSFGAIIKMIEEIEPAEFYKDKELFKDFDGIGEYIDKYIIRPLRNFVTNSKEYLSLDDGDMEKDMDDDDGYFDDFDDEEVED